MPKVLVAGKEEVYLRYFFSTWCYDPGAIDEEAVAEYVRAYSQPGAFRRSVQRKFNVTQGKNFDGSGSIGPWLVPYVSEDQVADIRPTTRVNNETARTIAPAG